MSGGSRTQGSPYQAPRASGVWKSRQERDCARGLGAKERMKGQRDPRVDMQMQMEHATD
jgi:hypothetical protein